MQVGDLVKSICFCRAKCGAKCGAKCQIGMIVNVDPLLRKGRRESPINEIVILLSNGSILYDNPSKWERTH